MNGLINAKNELLDVLKDKAPIKCAKIWTGYDFEHEDNNYILLKIGYSNPTDLDEFFNSLDFEYDNGYGGQNLFGTIWLNDGTWLTRGEYDGSEWWDYNKLPLIPIELT